MEIHSVQFERGVVSKNDMPAGDRAEIAFIGRSNVGKSSLINRLLGRKAIARTSSTPGKTQEFNYYLVNETFYFVDLPGLGYARTSKTTRASWARRIRGYVGNRPQLKLIYHLVDSRHPPGKQDHEMFELLRESPAAIVIALTKADKLSGNQRPVAVRQTQEALLKHHLELPIVLSSAVDGRGRKELLNWMDSLVA